MQQNITNFSIGVNPTSNGKVCPKINIYLVGAEVDW